MRENVRVRRGFVLAAPPGGAVGGYVHQPAGPGVGRIAAAVALSAGGGGVPQVRVQRRSALLLRRCSRWRLSCTPLSTSHALH